MCADVLNNNAWNILALLKECVWGPYFGYKEKVEKLRSKNDELISRKKDIMVEIEIAERYSSKPLKAVVINWLSNVEKLEQAFEGFEQKVKQTFHYSPSRIRLSKRADKIWMEMEDLREQSAFPEGYFLDVDDEKQLPLATTNLKGQLFEKDLWEVLLSLKLTTVSRIGIYGMGGVGKTTLATHIHDHLLNDSSFSGNVYWITVSRDFSITKLQDGIAKILKLDLSTEDDERKRTAKLSHTLKRKESFVLILDDVWSSFKVEEVGIPMETGGGKLIITSRLVEVCEGIGCQKQVKVRTLSSIESWELFVETLNHNGDLPKDIEEIGKKMAKKCDGLPQGLITIAASMRGVTDVFEWREAFREFEESCTQVEYMNDNVFPIFRYSYNRLRNQRLQKCFLYCCLYPEDYKIERDELIHLFIAEEFLERRKSRLAEFDQGHVVLNKLERACLLESVEYRGKRCVRMHDLVREMALQIGRDKFKWMVKAGAQLREIPGEQEWSTDLDKISLMDNGIREISVPLSYVLPLTTLLLQRNKRLSLIVDHFFVQMSGLRVLDLSDTAIEKLPCSVSNLESLSTLLLRNCRKLKFVLPLDKHKKLIELDLYGAGIEEVPQGVESLVNLRFLDIRRGIPFKNPAVDILARLSNLQSLSISFVVRVEDLLGMGMRQLEVFHGGFIDVCSFNRFVQNRQTNKMPSVFEIVLDLQQPSNLYSYGTGEGKRVKLNNLVFTRYNEIEVEEERDVELKGLVVTGDNVEMLCYDEIEVEEKRDVILLPLDTQELEITDSEFRTSKFCTSSNSFLDAIPSLIQSKDLKEIKVCGCVGIEFLMRLSNCSSTGDDGLTSTCLQYLESLHLRGLNEFSGLCKLELGEALPPAGTFSHLRCLQVWECNKMKKLIPRWLLQYLRNLTEIDVRYCDEMEEIITEDEEEQFKQWASSSSSSSILPSNQSRSINDDELVLPKLQDLRLGSLRKLKSIYKGRMTCISIQSITVLKCPKVKRLPLTLPLRDGQPSAPPALEFIDMHYVEWESLEWEHPQYKYLLHPFFREVSKVPLE